MSIIDRLMYPFMIIYVKFLLWNMDKTDEINRLMQEFKDKFDK